MNKSLRITLGGGLLVCCILLVAYYFTDNQHPTMDIPDCPYEDTVNLTGSTKFTNGSYLYEGVIIPPDLIGIYDYEIIHKGERESVIPHPRGCVCKLKTCVKFCCHPKSKKKINYRECEEAMSEEIVYSPYVNVTFDDGSLRSVHVLDEFVVQTGVPCSLSFQLVPQESDDDNWELFENGSLLRKYDRKFLTKTDYCLNPGKIDNITVLNPINCLTESQLSTPQQWNIIAMMISIPFLVATIFVYAWIPQLRNLQGKCLICYLTAVCVSWALLVSMSSFSPRICNILGFATYYSLMAAFFWLNVISFDLWMYFNGVNRSMQLKRFLFYSIYAWTCPALLTALTILAQITITERLWSPGITGNSCWLKYNDWSAFLYFYGPVLIILICNVTMFALTARNIHIASREAAADKQEESKRINKYLISQKNNFTLFLRLFILMGVSWLLEVISYLFGPESALAYIFVLTDLFNAFVGVIVFVVFVLRPKVRKLIWERITNNSDNPRRSGSDSSGDISLQDCIKDGITE